MPNNCSEHGGSFHFGTISHGTLRTQDLLRSFADECERLMPFNTKDLVSEARANAEILDMFKKDGSPVATNRDHEIAQYVLDDLTSQLCDIANKHEAYFGAHEGDGSDFGFWSRDTCDYDD